MIKDVRMSIWTLFDRIWLMVDRNSRVGECWLLEDYGKNPWFDWLNICCTPLVDPAIHGWKIYM